MYNQVRRILYENRKQTVIERTDDDKKIPDIVPLEQEQVQTIFMHNE